MKIIVSDGIYTNFSYVKIRTTNVSSLTSAIKNSMQLQTFYSITVMENQTETSSVVEKPLLSVWPQHAEFGEILEFRLLNRHDSFILDSQSGLLWLNRKAPLDREFNDKFQLGIQAIINRSDYKVIFFLKVKFFI